MYNQHLYLALGVLTTELTTWKFIVQRSIEKRKEQLSQTTKHKINNDTHLKCFSIGDKS